MKLKRIPECVRRVTKRFVFTEPVASSCAKHLSRYYGHLQWKVWHKASPEWFDHRIDLYRWPDHLNAHWVERGTYSKEVMFPGCKASNLACGDGFYALYFYVATGVGTLLITDRKQNLCDMFKPGNEVVAYRSPEDCVELIQYYLQHDVEREVIARAGQQRTLREHTYYHRMQELVDILRKTTRKVNSSSCYRIFTPA